MGIPYSQGSDNGRPQIDASSCSLCGTCVGTCPVGVLSVAGEAIAVDAEAAFGCIACSQCALVCPTGAISVGGRGADRARVVALPARGTKATPEQLGALFLARRSVRRFTTAEIPRAALERIVGSASTAPMGIPPWDVGVTVLHGREKVRALSRDGAETYRGMLRVLDNPVGRGLLRLLASKATASKMTDFVLPPGREIVEAASREKDKVLYDAPAALLFYASPFADEADPYIACTYAMLAAEAEGLGTTMIGCAKPPLARRKDVLRRYGIPAGSKPKIVLIMGEPDVRCERAIERPFSSVSYA